MKEQVLSVTVAYTMEQATKLIPCSRRWLQGFLATDPTDSGGTPFYYTIGNRKMFTDADIDRIRNFNREIVRCQLSSLRRVKASRRTTMAAAPTSESLLTEAQRLTGSKLQGGFSNSGRMTSNVVALPRTKDQRS
jgi:hypothetical protein